MCSFHTAHPLHFLHLCATGFPSVRWESCSTQQIPSRSFSLQVYAIDCDAKQRSISKLPPQKCHRLANCIHLPPPAHSLWSALLPHALAAYYQHCI